MQYVLGFIKKTKNENSASVARHSAGERGCSLRIGLFSFLYLRQVGHRVGIPCAAVFKHPCNEKKVEKMGNGVLEGRNEEKENALPFSTCRAPRAVHSPPFFPLILFKVPFVLSLFAVKGYDRRTEDHFFSPPTLLHKATPQSIKRSFLPLTFQQSPLPCGPPPPRIA